MFRILVADDEKVTRRGIVTMLMRDLHEEIECLEAGNGEEALKIVSSQMVDLIITDICMPLCSGLEFVERLRSTNREMTVLIISGYDNFEYARQAVRLGVRDYIMKPIRKEEFLDLVESCIAEIQKQQMSVREQSETWMKQVRLISEVRNEALISLIRGIDAELQIQRLSAMDEMINDPFFFLAVLQYNAVPEVADCIGFVVKNIIDECLRKEGFYQKDQPVDADESLRKAVSFQSVATGRNEITILFGVPSTEYQARIGRSLVSAAAVLRQTTRAKTAVGTGEMVYALVDLNKTYKMAEAAANFKIFGLGKSLVTYREIAGDDSLRTGESRHIPRWIEPSEENLPDIQRRFSIQLKENPDAAVLSRLRGDFETLCSLISERLKSRGASEWSGRTFPELWDEFDLRREIRDRVLYLKSTENEGTREQSGMIQEIIAFTREHVTEEIDLNFLAEHFGKSPGYIGTLFRKGSGQGFNEFVTAERMKIAQHLLLDHALTVQDVARRCGYYNTKYFSVVFKKETGTSPKQYQMKAGIQHAIV